MNSIYAEAKLRLLLASEEGDLERPILTGTRGLLLKFEADDGGEVPLGVVVQLRGCHRLLPGEEG